MKVGVVLPTYNDGKKWYEMLTRFTSSLYHIREVDNLEFLVNYQNIDPKSYDDIIMSNLEDMIYKLNPTWDLIYTVSPKYPKPISMVRIRNDCMKLDLECDLYLYLDDDVKFNPGAGECYKEIIQFFEADPKLGLVMSAGYLGGYNYVGKLKYAVEKHWMTNKGFFFRNLHISSESPIYPEEAISTHEGGYEEMLVAMEIAHNGYKMATHFNNPTTHKIQQMDVDSKKIKDRYEDDAIHDLDTTFTSIQSYLSNY